MRFYRNKELCSKVVSQFEKGWRDRENGSSISIFTVFGMELMRTSTLEGCRPAVSMNSQVCVSFNTAERCPDWEAIEQRALKKMPDGGCLWMNNWDDCGNIKREIVFWFLPEDVPVFDVLVPYCFTSGIPIS